jgi:hypothetical protein
MLENKKEEEIFIMMMEIEEVIFHLLKLKKFMSIKLLSRGIQLVTPHTKIEREVPRIIFQIYFQTFKNIQSYGNKF